MACARYPAGSVTAAKRFLLLLLGREAILSRVGNLRIKIKSSYAIRDRISHGSFEKAALV